MNKSKQQWHLGSARLSCNGRCDCACNLSTLLGSTSYTHVNMHVQCWKNWTWESLVNLEAFLDPDDDLDWSTYTLLRSFLSGGASQSHPSKLSCVVSEDIHLDWDSPLFTDTITHLEIGFSQYMLSHADPPTLQTFASLLSRMTNLQYLRLANLLPIYNSATDSNLQVVLPGRMTEVDFTAAVRGDWGASVSIGCLSLYICLVIPENAEQSIFIFKGAFASLMVQDADAVNKTSSCFFSLRPGEWSQGFVDVADGSGLGVCARRSCSCAKGRSITSEGDPSGRDFERGRKLARSGTT